MRNDLYHEFVVGFNYWMVVAAVSAVVMVIIGLYRWGMIHGRPYCFYGEKPFRAVAAVLASIFTVFVMVESFAGVVQMFDNAAAANDSAVWSFILAPLAIMFAGLAFFGVLYYVGIIAGWAKEGYLREARREEQRKRNRISARRLGIKPSRKRKKKSELEFLDEFKGPGCFDWGYGDSDGGGDAA